MSRDVVCDASALVALLTDGGSAGAWATQALGDAHLAAPSLAPYEAANILRRHGQAGLLGRDVAAQAHADLLDLAVEEWPHAAVATRTWELRDDLTVYDASYVALAELLRRPLVTLDARLARAPGIRCRVECPALLSDG